MQFNLPVEYDRLSRRERQLVRERYVHLQGGLCCYCGESLDGRPSAWVRAKHVNRKLFPPNFFDNPVHLHHDHFTGLTVGAAHALCNAVMWQYEGQ